jgi:hypothetical protein
MNLPCTVVSTSTRSSQIDAAEPMADEADEAAVQQKPADYPEVRLKTSRARV